jgi:hypothetical protein
MKTTTSVMLIILALGITAAFSMGENIEVQNNISPYEVMKEWHGVNPDWEEDCKSSDFYYKRFEYYFKIIGKKPKDVETLIEKIENHEGKNFYDTSGVYPDNVIFAFVNFNPFQEEE